MIPIKCNYCGRFMNMNETYITYEPYGGPTDLEPPDDEFMHKSCWDTLQRERQQLILKTSYIKPREINPNREPYINRGHT
jgi:hypothetical protein